MIAVATIVLILYIGFIGFVLKKTFEGDAYYLLLYILFTLPFYTTFQLVIFKGFDLSFLVDLFKYSKDFVFFTGFFVFIFGKKESFIQYKWQPTLLDKLFLGFMTLTLIYTLIPLGEAPFLSKIIYAKNTFLIGIVYFLGRNTTIDKQRWRFIVKVLIYLSVGSFLFALTETILGMHLQNILDYGRFNLLTNDIFPSGNYGLSWTFERPGPIKRFGSFFADPLEFASFLLLGLSAVLFKIYNSKLSINRLNHFVFFLLIIIGIYLSYSRSVIISVFLMLLISLFLIKKYRLLIKLIFGLLFISLITYYNSNIETKYFIMDTLTFQNSSSLGHLVKWIQGILSIIDNPLGSGLGTSGNSLSVDNEISIGGENQFIIIGVQLGLIGLLNYTGLIFYSIRNSYKLYNLENDRQFKYLPFIVCCLKFALIFPLLTSNAEIYTFLSLCGWFLVGLNERRYNNLKPNPVLN